jgi:hypothetical protein
VQGGLEGCKPSNYAMAVQGGLEGCKPSKNSSFLVMVPALPAPSPEIS